MIHPQPGRGAPARRTAIANRVHDRFASVISNGAEPCLMEEIHVAVKNVAAERRVGEHVIHGRVGKMRETVRGRERVFHVAPAVRTEQRGLRKQDFVGAHRGFDLPAEKLEDVPFVVDRRDVIGLILRIQRPLGAPLVAA